MGQSVSLTNRQRSWMFVNIMITSISTSLLMTAINTALNPIAEEIGVSYETGQWLVSGYQLAMAIIMPLTAFLIRRVKTKDLYIFAIGLFLVGLVIDMVGNTFFILMVGRVLQALGNGIITSMTQVVILSIYPPEKKGTAMGWYGLAVAVAPVIAPTLGGFLVDLISWRAIFGFALIFTAIAFVMAFFVFKNALDTYKEKLDIVSFILSIFAFGGITLGLGNLASYGITNISVWLSLVVGIVAAVFFVIKQNKMEKAFLNVKVMKSKGYVIAVLSNMIMYAVVMGQGILIPYYFENIKGFTATISGLLILPGAAVNAVISPFAGRIYDKMGIENMALPSAIVMLISNLGLFFVGAGTPSAIIAVLYGLRCLAVGYLLMPMVTWGTSCVDKTLLSDATALLSSLRTIGGSLGSAVFSGIMTSVAASSAATYGANAEVHGFNISFICMSILPAILLVFAIIMFTAKKQSKDLHYTWKLNK